MKKVLFLAFVLTIFHNSFSQTYIGVSGGLNLSRTNIDEPTETLLSGWSSYSVEPWLNTHFGAFLSNGLGTRGKLNLQAGFYVTNKGYSAEFDETVPGVFSLQFDRDYNIRYFEVPLTIKYVLGRADRKIDPYILGGVYGGFARNAQVIHEIELFEVATGETTLILEEVTNHKPFNEADLADSNPFLNTFYLSNKMDFGYTFGGGFAFNLGGPKLFIEGRTAKSFNNRSIFVDGSGNFSEPKIQNSTFYLSVGLMAPLIKAKQVVDFDN